jgi:hypothetical protein
MAKAKSLGQLAYEAWPTSSPPTPWRQRPLSIRNGWHAVATAIREETLLLASQEMLRRGDAEVAAQIGGLRLLPTRYVEVRNAKHAFPMGQGGGRYRPLRKEGYRETCTRCGAAREWSVAAQRWMYVRKAYGMTITVKHITPCGGE